MWVIVRLMCCSCLQEAVSFSPRDASIRIRNVREHCLVMIDSCIGDNRPMRASGISPGFVYLKNKSLLRIDTAHKDSSAQHSHIEKDLYEQLALNDGEKVARLLHR